MHWHVCAIRICVCVYIYYINKCVWMYVCMYIRVNMVIHHHRRRYVNKLDLSSVAGRGGTHEEVRWELYRKKEGRGGNARSRNTERGQEIMCKRLSSHTHDPSDRIQIYWFLAYTSKIGGGGGERERDSERNRVRRAVWCERKPGILRSWFRSNVRLGFVLPRAINLPAIRKCAYSSVDEENDAIASPSNNFSKVGSLRYRFFAIDARKTRIETPLVLRRRNVLMR